MEFLIEEEIINMKLLTTEQKNWLLTKNIKVGSFYMFPRFGFNIYEYPNSKSINIDTNPFTRSLDHEYFNVKEKRDSFVRGNFLNKPHRVDFWMKEDELSNRGLFESLILLIISFVPFVIYNQFKSIKRN